MTHFLSGIHVLVTRPKLQALPLSEAITAKGGHAVVFQTIDIQPLANRVIEAELAGLPDPHILIFISTNAVVHSWPWVEKLLKQSATKITIAAIGEATAAALNERGVTDVVLPLEKPYNSENLLAHPLLQVVVQQVVWIVRGEEGKTHLAETLRHRGAIVHALAVYRRCQPKLDPTFISAFLSEQKIDIILTTSRDNLQNFVLLLPPAQANHFFSIPIIVVSETMKNQAKQLGFQEIIRAEGADTQSLLAALHAWHSASVSKS